MYSAEVAPREGGGGGGGGLAGVRGPEGEEVAEDRRSGRGRCVRLRRSRSVGCLSGCLPSANMVAWLPILLLSLQV